MTSIVRQIEAAVVAAVKTATGNSALVRGFRESVAPGYVKTSDGDGRPEVLVTVSHATSDGYASPVLEYSVSVVVTLDWSDDPTISGVDATAAAIELMLHHWNMRQHIQAMSTALSTENFRCDGFKLDGGSDEVDAGDSSSSFSVEFNFAIKGVFTETQTNQEA